MKSEILINKVNFFKIEFKEKLKPEICKRINDGELKVILSKDYINNTLNVDYELGYLFFKIKEILLDTELNVSIRKLKREFVFYKKIDGINKECDIFKVTFNESLKPRIFRILENKNSISFEENFLKNYLNINYSTDRIYKKLKNLLINDDITISLKRNVKTNNHKSNHFIFYRKVDELFNIEDEYKKIYYDKEIDFDEENFKSYIEESELEDIILKREIYKKSFNGLLEDINKEINKKEEFNSIKSLKKKQSSLDDNNYCKCPKCKGELKYFSKKCTHCGKKFNWKCPECENIIENSSNTCEHCGTELYI